MAPTFANALGQIVDLCHQRLENVNVVRHEVRDQVALLEVEAQYGRYRLHIREIWQSAGPRKYAYYVLQDELVIVGFDNAPDPQALQLKYGSAYAAHRQERVPHRHTTRKEAVVLTADLSFAEFLDWLMVNLT